MRHYVLIAAIIVLSACSSDKPPSTVGDACRMQDERPYWFKAMEKTEKKWGVPV